MKLTGYLLASFYFVIPFLGVYGWVWNIIKLIHSVTLWSGLDVVRAVGIFVAPLGAVIGWF